MSEAEAIRLFNEGNHLWFAKGNYNEALPVYRQALKEDPSSPIILYQLAKVLWTFEEFEEVKQLVAQAEKHQERFSEYGQQKFAKEKPRLLDASPFVAPLSISIDRLNMKQIATIKLSKSKWSDLAFAAEERQLFKLAEYALDKSKSSTSLETEKEKLLLERVNRTALSSLRAMLPQTEKQCKQNPIQSLQVKAIRLFNEANLLWFEDGSYNKALPLYQEALNHYPSSPAILYQLANVLWSFDELDEAGKLIARIETHQERFSDFGKQMFLREKPRLLAVTPLRKPLPIPIEKLDLKKKAWPYPSSRWSEVFLAAKQRHLFHLAAYALEIESGFQQQFFHLEREKRQLYRENRKAWSDLRHAIREREYLIGEKLTIGTQPTSAAEAIRLFEEANHLWFGEGCFYLYQALRLYRKALKCAPSSPAILYQLANAFWAFEKFEEVRQLVAEAEKHQDRFSEYGKQKFAEEKPRLLNPSPFKKPMPIQIYGLDLERIESMNYSLSQWWDISHAAEERHLFNLAEFSFDRGLGNFTDGGFERDKRDLRDKSRSAWYDLRRMMPET